MGIRNIVTGLGILCLGFGLHAQVAPGPGWSEPVSVRVSAAWDKVGDYWPATGLSTGAAGGTAALPPGPEFEGRLAAISREIPAENNPRVQRYVHFFLQEKRSATEAVLALAQRNLPVIESELRQTSLPDVLKYLPAAASGFNPQFVGAWDARGCWQLRTPEAIAMGLRVENGLDERGDLRRSTQASLRWLQLLHTQYQGDWKLTLSAWACGPAVVNRAITRAGTRSYSAVSTYLPPEGRDLLPAFMAMAYVFTYAQELGLRTPALTPLPAADTVRLPRPLNRDLALRNLHLDPSLLAGMNPALMGDVLPPVTCGYGLCVPVGRGSAFMQALPGLYAQMEREAAADREAREKAFAAAVTPPAEAAPATGQVVWYTIRSGDNLGKIAEKYHVTVSQLRTWNNLHSDNIRAGARLKIYPKGKPAAAPAAATPAPSPTPETAPDSPATPAAPVWISHTVRPGETLWSIARQYPGVTERDLMDWNQTNSNIQPGQKLRIQKKP